MLKLRWYLVKNLLELKEGDSTYIISKKLFFAHFDHVTQITPPHDMRPSVLYFIGSVYNHTRVSLPSSYTHVVVSETRSFGYSHTSDDCTE